MGGRVRRVMVIGTAVAALAAIGGTALAHESSTVGDSFLGDFARHLGVSPAKVREAYQATVIDRIEAAVKAGRLTRAQADAIEARVKSHQGGPFLFGGPRPGFDHHGPFEHHGVRSSPTARRPLTPPPPTSASPRTRSTRGSPRGRPWPSSPRRTARRWPGSRPR